MTKRTCTVLDCPKPAQNAGGQLCSMHYSRQRRNGTVGEAGLIKPWRRFGCLVEGCTNKHKAAGYCSRHYANFSRHGDPIWKGRGLLAGELSPHWKLVPGYSAMHTRVRTQRGNARSFQCCCGSPARQWAYDHSDPDEIWGVMAGYLLPYSTDPSRYDPLCTFCHRRRDLDHASARRRLS